MSFDKPPLPLFLFGALPAEIDGQSGFDGDGWSHVGGGRFGSQSLDRPRIGPPRELSLAKWRSYREALRELPDDEPGLNEAREGSDRMIKLLTLLDN